MSRDSFPLNLSGVVDPRALIDEAARRDLMSFLLLTYPLISGGSNLKLNWHLEAIAYALSRVRSGECRRLIITLPPRQLKSIMTSVVWVAWLLGQDPSLKIVCVSYSNELAIKHARDCRAIMQSSVYARLFPRTRIRSSRTAVHDFETTSGGGRLATSISGTLTGRGGDIIIIDDPIKPDEALSDVTRNFVNNWYRTTMVSRPDDKTRSATLLVMQRLHQDDLAGTLLATGAWEELRLPAIATEETVIPLTRGRCHRRNVGDVLHPSREPLPELMAIKHMIGSEPFNAQYQQQPVPPQGNMIHASWLHSYEALPSPPGPGAQVVQSWDTASKDGINCDWSVCVTALIDGQFIYVVDVWRGKVEFPALLRMAIQRAQAFKADVILIEDQASGMQLLQALRSARDLTIPPPIARKPESDKRSRVFGVSAMMEAGRLKLPTEALWLADFKSEILAFPSGRHDDQVDALSQLLTWELRRHRYADQGVPAAPIVAGYNW